MKNKRVVIFSVISIVTLISSLPLCTGRQNPYNNASNARLSLIIPAAPDTGYLVGDSISIGIDIFLAHLADSVYISSGNSWDTTLMVTMPKEACTLSIKIPLLKAGSDTIEVTLYLEDGSRQSKTTIVSVKSKAITFVQNLTGTAGGRAGESCRLTVSATGTGPLFYQWYKNSVAIAGKTDTFLVIESLQPNDSGEYYCVVRDNYGKSATSRITVLIVKPADTPDAPTGLRINLQSDTALVVSWRGAANADGYKVYRDTIEHSTVAPIVSVTDTTAVVQHNSRPCYIWVTAVKSAGGTILESMPSTALYWEPDANRLYPPQNVKAVRLDSTNVLISWDHVDSATFYIVMRNTHRNLPGFIQIAAPRDTAYTDAGAVSNNYYYYVLAANAADTSDAADTVGITDSTNETPLPPGITDCQVIQPGTSINDKIVEVLQSSLHKGTICPVPGRYDYNTIEVLGKLEVWIR